MGKSHHPRRGSMQFWPRKRAKVSLARIRSWKQENKPKLLGFIAYKATMSHLIVVDNRPKSLTKGEKISMAATVVDCPPMTIAGVSLYKKTESGLKKINSFFSEKVDKSLSRKLNLPKKKVQTANLLININPNDFDDLRILAYSKPPQSVGAKKPKMLEFVLGGNKESKLSYAKEILGRELQVLDVFEDGAVVDVHGITKGKGFQGTVKRYGVPIRHHKSEKTKRGIGTLGPWTPKRVQFTVPQPGKMGYHLRTEYNKQIIKIGSDGKSVSPQGGIYGYGVINNSYLLVKGSIMGPKKMAVVLTQAIRSNQKLGKESYQLVELIK